MASYYSKEQMDQIAVTIATRIRNTVTEDSISKALLNSAQHYLMTVDDKQALDLLISGAGGNQTPALDNSEYISALDQAITGITTPTIISYGNARFLGLDFNDMARTHITVSKNDGEFVTFNRADPEFSYLVMEEFLCSNGDETGFAFIPYPQALTEEDYAAGGLGTLPGIGGINLQGKVITSDHYEGYTTGDNIQLGYKQATPRNLIPGGTKLVFKATEGIDPSLDIFYTGTDSQVLSEITVISEAYFGYSTSNFSISHGNTNTSKFRLEVENGDVINADFTDDLTRLTFDYLTGWMDSSGNTNFSTNIVSTNNLRIKLIPAPQYKDVYTTITNGYGSKDVDGNFIFYLAATV